MKVEHLHYLCTVAEQGSISKAARLLYMTQPQLSTIIREIEAETHCPLFVRRSDGVTLTPTGERAVVHAKKILNEYSRFIELSEEPRTTQSFSLSSVRTSLVLDCFLELLRRYDSADIHFAMRETGSPQVVDDVYAEDADLGVVYLLRMEQKSFSAKLASKKLAYQMVCPLRHYIILSRKHPLLQAGKPITKEMLYPYGMLRFWKAQMYGEGNADSIWYNSFLDLRKISRFIDVYDRATMHNLLLNTNFFAIGTKAGLFQEDIHQIVSVPLFEDDLSPESILEMGLVVRRSSLPLKGIPLQFSQILFSAYRDPGGRERDPF